ncbi:uncharacterized protein I303_106542 [Kwoniella dejecticola CBS 10117]|uniref:NmrA-like domain-containing protein n=1 Tax=Kwoniella dejecticola CBS 10117 TaxID=1296121 RepID=A0A1A5ZUE9_9TREE|nr:uncharacterized protein I303_08201 [Kwoniella dejecticola CBS 10117]OBR81431.1 hypothetical protein I303_08201 [Kwoniella dejecticola CBS 10117]
MSTSKHYVIFGATGKQGGAVVKWLAPSHTELSIFAVTRDPSSSKAQSLASLTNVHLIQGDASNAETVFKSAESKIDGVFFVNVGYDAASQLEQGKTAIDLAKKYQAGHFVFSSTDFSGHREKDTGIAAIEAKKLTEDHLVASGLTYTIIRPVGFLENLFLPGYIDAIPHFWPPHLLKSGIRTDDIGRAASEILLDPRRFGGKTIGLSGYEGSPQDWMDAWQSVTGEDLRQREKKMSGGMDEERIKLLKFIMLNQNDARVADTKALFPWVSDLSSFLVDAKKNSLI